MTEELDPMYCATQSDTLDAILTIEEGDGDDRDWCVLANAGLIPHLQGSYQRGWVHLVETDHVRRGHNGRWYAVDDL